MIIDSHGHFTTVPDSHTQFRSAQKAGQPALTYRAPSDDAVREALETNQLRVMRERGSDLVVFSPQASAMEHHLTDVDLARQWAEVCNDLIHQVTRLYPGNFAGVCQLPQTPEGGLETSIVELRRCVEELGFVGCNLNPDPSGGLWTSPPMTDQYWFPLYEVLVELDVPAMIHVSASCNPAVHTLGAHYLNADTSVIMQLVQEDLFNRFPSLRFIIPHGGGAVPYHWGRYRGLAERLGRPDPAELLRNLFFDTSVYHQPGIDLLREVIPSENIVFASEMLGAVRGADPRTGVAWDDTRRYVESSGFDESELAQVLAGNARRIYPRLDALLTRQGR